MLTVGELRKKLEGFSDDDEVMLCVPEVESKEEYCKVDVQPAVRAKKKFVLNRQTLMTRPSKEMKRAKRCLLIY